MIGVGNCCSQVQYKVRFNENANGIISVQQSIIIVNTMVSRSYPLLLLLIVIVNSSWTPETDPDENNLTAGICRMETMCRTPNMSEYKYNGVIRSGYLKVDLKNGSALGFMFFGKIGATVQELKNYPLIVSLGGGPGISSQFNNFKQIGPLLIKKVFSVAIEDNKYTWAKDANLLFIDQPVGTGVSCLASSNYIPVTMSDVVVDFYRAFNQLFSEDANGCFNSKNLGISPSISTFIFGEGFGGKFASAIAAKFINEKKNGGPITGLKGVGIGGGLISPFRILSELGNYGFSMSLLDYQERMRIEKIILRANFNQQSREWSKMKTDFEKALDYLYERSGVSYYDITRDGFQEDLLQYFFTTPGNLEKLGFEKSITFQSFSKQVYNKLASDFMLPETQNVEFILSQKIPILLYQGQDDAYSNPTGAMRWIEELRFDNAEEFRNKTLSAWKANGLMLGSIKSAGKLTFVVVNDAGHYVPKDNPVASYILFSSWMKANL